MKFLLFMIFGTIEQLGLLYLCCSLFRFKASSYMLKFIIVGVPILAGNYLIRLEDPISGLAPLFALIMFILFVRVFLNEVSLLWATIMGIVSYIILGLIQSLILIVVIILHLTTLINVQHNSFEGYGLQLITALLSYYVAQFLYKRGIGFTFALDRFKLIGENIVMLIILIIFLIAIGIIFFINDVFIIIFVLALPFLYLIYFAVRKQREDVKNTSYLE